MTKYLLSGLLALGFVATNVSFAETVYSDCSGYESSQDWGDFCSCYSQFIDDNCNSCTNYGILCTWAADMAKGQSESMIEGECEEQVANAPSMPSCTSTVTVNQCTQGLVDYNAHC